LIPETWGEINCEQSEHLAEHQQKGAKQIIAAQADTRRDY